MSSGTIALFVAMMLLSSMLVVPANVFAQSTGVVKQTIGNSNMQLYVEDVEVNQSSTVKVVSVSVVFKNLDHQPQLFNQFFMKLKDSEGRDYSPEFDSNLPSAYIPSLDIARGTAVFEIPASSDPDRFYYAKFFQTGLVVDLTQTMAVPDDPPVSDWEYSSNEGFKADDGNTEITIINERYSGQYYIIDITVRNIGDESISYNPFYANVKDSGGNVYSHDFFVDLSSPLLSGDLVPSDFVRGDLAFDVGGEPAPGLMFIWASGLGFGSYINTGTLTAPLPEPQEEEAEDVGSTTVAISSVLEPPQGSPMPRLSAWEAKVYIEGTSVIAIRADGSAISSGVAGTGDRSVIQAALDSMTSGGTLLFSKGTYRADGAIHITYAGTTIDGGGATIQATADVGKSAMIVSIDLSNITVKNLILDANNVARRTLNIVGNTVDISNIRVENVETKNTIAGYIWPALRVSASFSGGSANNVVIINSYFHDHPEDYYDNISLGRINGLVLSGNTFEDLGTNVLFYGGQNHVITGNRFVNIPVINIQADNAAFVGNGVYGGSTARALQVTGFNSDHNPDANDTENVLIADNILQDIKVQLIESGVEAARRITVSDNLIARTTINTDDRSDSGIIIQNQNATNMINVVGNMIRGHGRAGILLNNSDYTTITNNYFIDNGGDTSISVRGNIIDFHAAPNASNNNQIIGNVFSGVDLTVDKHLWIRGDDNYMQDNRFDGTATTLIDDDGTNIIRNNSQVSNIRLDEAEKRLSFHGEGEDGTQGTSIIAVDSILAPPYTVTVDGEVWDDVSEITVDDSGERLPRVSYNHSVHDVTITGANVVPEFGLVAALVLAVSVAAVIGFARLKSARIEI